MKALIPSASIASNLEQHAGYVNDSSLEVDLLLCMHARVVVVMFSKSGKIQKDLNPLLHRADHT
jgi:hypothetical protein